MALLRGLILAERPASARAFRQDGALTVLVGAVCAVLALTVHDARDLDGPGWLLLAGSVLPLVWRRRYPMTVLVVAISVAAIYHAQDYHHAAPLIASMLAVYTVSAVGPRTRTLGVGAAVIVLVAVIWSGNGGDVGMELVRISGWILAVIAFGEAVRVHRGYLAAVNERAERAERTREEEAARRVAEERLRIARDLHDLLAHSITLIGVQTSVASHVLRTDPGQLDRAAVATALDGIADTCRDARSELRTTLQVLRAGVPDSKDPLPGLAGLPDLARAAESAGATVGLTVDVTEPLPGAVEAAVYRIAQEALTNAVRHAGPSVRVTVAVGNNEEELWIRVTDDGTARRTAAPTGFGIVGMRERVRSVNGTLEAAPRTDAPGFTVRARLPLPRATAKHAPSSPRLSS